MQPQSTSSDYILPFDNIPQGKSPNQRLLGPAGLMHVSSSPKYILVMQLKKERCLLLRKPLLHKSPKMSALQLRVGRSGLQLNIISTSPDDIGYGVGDLVTLTLLSDTLSIVLRADNGPCVSGAHNTIVTARAGKDLISSLVSARHFKDACDKSLTPYEFVEGMKKKGIRVPGIGHRIKE
ncbi:Flavodoxin-like domain-containing protein [Raphanus sativus]|nr:Flavodoxin-like domain-containing protein [Raphanus sativus]